MTGARAPCLTSSNVYNKLMGSIRAASSLKFPAIKHETKEMQDVAIRKILHLNPYIASNGSSVSAYNIIFNYFY